MVSWPILIVWLMPCIAFSQVSTANKTGDKRDTARNKQDNYTPEIFTSGFIDVVNNGQVNASARFIRLMIGDPGRFAIPLSFYGGVSNNNFQGTSLSSSQLLKSNDQLINQYINPLSGLVNISVDNIIYFKKTDKPTRFGFLYHFGGRVLTGTTIGPISNPATGKPVNFLNGFLAPGAYFQTGAWERNNTKNVGIFWIAGRYHICYSNPENIRKFLPDIETNGVYTGFSLGFGVEINNLVNLKAIYYKYFKAPEIDYGYPIYQFSFNYSLKK